MDPCGHAEELQVLATALIFGLSATLYNRTIYPGFYLHRSPRQGWGRELIRHKDSSTDMEEANLQQKKG